MLCQAREWAGAPPGMPEMLQAAASDAVAEVIETAGLVTARSPPVVEFMLEYQPAASEWTHVGAASGAAGDTSMFHVCMFGGYEGRLAANKRVVLTMFGACELHRPTLARRLLTRRARPNDPKPVRQRPIVITLFGSAEITLPTLAEEFLDLREAVRSGALTPDALDDLLADLATEDDGAVFSLTMFGACDEAGLPEEDVEVDSLALQRHLGNISDNQLQILQFGVGQDEAQRRAVLRQAIAART